jgi:hypothetical protein
LTTFKFHPYTFKLGTKFKLKLTRFKKNQNKDCKNGEPIGVFDLDPKLMGFNFLKNKKN